MYSSPHAAWKGWRCAHLPPKSPSLEKKAGGPCPRLTGEVREHWEGGGCCVPPRRHHPSQVLGGSSAGQNHRAPGVTGAIMVSTGEKTAPDPTATTSARAEDTQPHLAPHVPQLTLLSHWLSQRDKVGRHKNIPGSLRYFSESSQFYSILLQTCRQPLKGCEPSSWRRERHLQPARLRGGQQDAPGVGSSPQETHGKVTPHQH